MGTTLSPGHLQGAPQQQVGVELESLARQLEPNSTQSCRVGSTLGQKIVTKNTVRATTWLIINISGLMFGPEPLVLVPSLRDELLRPCNRRKRTSRLFEKLELARRKWPLLIDTVDFDPVRGARNM